MSRSTSPASAQPSGTETVGHRGLELADDAGEVAAPPVARIKDAYGSARTRLRHLRHDCRLAREHPRRAPRLWSGTRPEPRLGDVPQRLEELLPCGDGKGQRRRVGVDHHRHDRSEEHTSELQSREKLVCRLLLEKKKKKTSF